MAGARNDSAVSDALLPIEDLLTTLSADGILGHGERARTYEIDTQHAWYDFSSATADGIYEINSH